jgi:type VI secretion system protein ImpL
VRKLLRLVFNRWVLGILGLVAIALLIWYVGPLIAIAGWQPLEPEWVRQGLIAIVVLVYVGKAVWKLLRTSLSNKQLLEGMLRQVAPREASAPGPGAEQVAELGKRFADAVGVLKRARIGQSRFAALGALTGRQYVYELPWYVIIGAPGSGKTTALLNAGLNFPLANELGKESIRGVGGTRNCDWWFTDEAVLLDTAGRFTTQDSDRLVDAAGWTGFLALLKKHRPRRPINGVLLAVSVADLLQVAPAERDAHATKLRARIQELHEHVGIRFPVYVLVTKTDLLAGFMEFFGEYGKEERAQVWGVTFPYSEKDADRVPLAGLGPELERLERRLNERLVDRTQQERDPQRRAAIYGFPQQWAVLKGGLAEFLAAVFQPSRFEQRPLVRGVYFTSGTQEGTPIDRAFGALGRALGLAHRGLAPHRPSGKSFFLTKLLQDVVFREAGLAGTNLRWERNRALLAWGAIGVALAITAGAILAWSVSYARNKAYVADVQARVDAIAKQVEGLQAKGSTDVVSLLPVLQSVRDLASASMIGDDSVPLTMGFGLFQGGKLGEAARTAHQRLLREAFLPRITARLEQQLGSRGEGNPELLYEALKAYIMLHERERFDAAAVKRFLTADWDASLPREVTLEQRRQLESHLDELLAEKDVVSAYPPDQRLLAAARQAVAETPIAVRAYNRLKRLGVGAAFPEFTIATKGGHAAPTVFARASGEPLTRGVPGLYSYDAYHKAFQAASLVVPTQLAQEATWVLADETRTRTALADADRVVAETRRLYLEDYARLWEAFVNDIRIIRPTSLQQSIDMTRTLSSPADSPLLPLFRAIVREVTLAQRAAGEKTVVDKGADLMQDKRRELEKLFGRHGLQVPAAPAASLEETIVDRRFDGLRRFVTSAAPGQPAPIDASVPLMNELYVWLVAAQAALNSKAQPPQTEVTNKIKGEAGRTPEPVGSMLTSLSAAATSLVLGTMRVETQAKLKGEVFEFCQKAIGGRYPFVRTSSIDVTQEDFSNLFAPGGRIDDFFQKNLAPIVDTSTKPWSYRPLGDARRGGTPASLRPFQQAQMIRDVFFRGGARTAGLQLEFKPVEMDASILQFLLDVDGQLVRYSHGPQVPAKVLWPGPSGKNQVRLALQPPSPGGTSGRVFDGPWALFRMLDDQKFEPTGQPDKFLVTFVIDGRRARFELLSSSVQNPFTLPELKQFQCPAGL